MADNFVGEIRCVGFNFPPLGWAFCNGQLMSISQNTALFSLLGTFYGGNGTSNFALPNLQGNFAVGQGQALGGQSYFMGETAGVASVNLTQQQMPAHTHNAKGTAAGGNSNSPAGALWAEARFGRVSDQIYATSGTPAPMAAQTLGSAGSTQPHNNLPPYLVMNFVIALSGIFPSRA